MEEKHGNFIAADEKMRNSSVHQGEKSGSEKKK